MIMTLQYLLDEKEIEDDLKMINKSKLLNVKKSTGKPILIMIYILISNGE